MSQPSSHQATSQHWYVTQLKPNGFETARRNLLRQGFTVFMPLRLSGKPPRRNARTVKPKPMFPGYLFVHTPDDGTNWRVINNTYGVSRLLLSNSSRPASLPIGFVEALRARCDENDLFISTDSIRPGDSISLISGPFAGLVAEVEALPQSGRVRVLLEILGRAVRSEMPTEHLDVVPTRPR